MAYNPGTSIPGPIYDWRRDTDYREIVLGGSKVLKAHRLTEFTFSDPDVWTDIPFELVSEASTLDGFVLASGGDFFGVDFYGIIMISGCVRPRWEGGGNPSVTVATRIMHSDDDGATWVEARCLQSVNGRAFNSDEQATFRYSGSIRTQPGSRFKLQARTTNTGMVFRGYTEFDNPTSVSLEAHKVGELPL